MLPTLLLSLALAQTPANPAPAQAALKLPAQIQAQPGQPFSVIAESNLKWIRWKIPSGLTRVPQELTACGDKGFVGYGPAGVYEFFVEGTLNDSHVEAKCVVFVGQPQPVPPGPNPGPVPPPDNSLTGELQRLYDADTGADKAKKRAKLAELWAQAAEQLCCNPQFTSVRQFRETMHHQSSLYPFFLQPTDLRAIRERIAGDLNAALGNDSAALGDAAQEGTPASPTRLKGEAVLRRYASALQAVR